MELEDNIHHPFQLAHLNIFAIQLSLQLYHIYLLAELVRRTEELLQLLVDMLFSLLEAGQLMVECMDDLGLDWFVHC